MPPGGRRRRAAGWRLLAVAGVCLALAGCAEYGLEPRVDAAADIPRRQASGPLARLLDPLMPKPVSLEEQQRVGDALAERMLRKVKLSRDKPKKRKVQGILRRLAEANPQTGLKWRVYLLDDPRPNAFTSGGGHLFITTGMVDVLGDDEKIATVLSHEMAHNVLAHVIHAQEKKAMARDAHDFSRRVAQSTRMEWLGRSLSFLINTSLNTYSRAQEDEADAEGLDYLVRAGWEPQAVLRTFDRLSRYFRDEPQLRNFFYGNHPTYKLRRWHLANMIRAHYRHQAGLPPVRRRNFGAGSRAAAEEAREPAGEAAAGLW